MSKRPADIYEINSSYSIAAATWGTLNGAGVPGNLYSPTIAPTSSETYEQGLQAMFLKNRLMLDVSHYTKRVFDRITNSRVNSKLLDTVGSLLILRKK